MNRTLTLSALLALGSLTAAAVEPAKFNITLDGGALITFHSFYNFDGETYEADNGNGCFFRLKGLYRINDTWSAGLGVGTYGIDGCNASLPLFVTAEYRPFASPKLSRLYLYGDLGYSFGFGKDSYEIGWSNGTFEEDENGDLVYTDDGSLGTITGTNYSCCPGLLAEFGIGYKLMLRKHFGFNFALGYNLQQHRSGSQKSLIEYADGSSYSANYDFKNAYHSIAITVGLVF